MTDFPPFPEFYEQVYGRSPFPWQVSLADRVAGGEWPDAVTVPTGLGKTATLVVAVWHLARQVAAGGKRTAPLRMLHVVDRTTIVDQTHRDITHLASALDQEDDDTPAGVVAGVLRTGFGLTSEDTVLLTGRVHGMRHDSDWVAAHRPVVVTMTAHQAVSRALFRGFGISPGMAPVHAALVGVDSLVLVDEPHLSVAAVPTMRAVKQHQHTYGHVGVPIGQIVALGATLPHAPASTVGVSTADREHPVSGARLRAEKTLTCHTATAKNTHRVSDRLAAIARDELQQHPDRPVAVVCNTVAAARQVHTALTGATGVVAEHDALLVTSRIRGWERGTLNEHLAGELPRLVVATQTIEAGVDLSVPTLVTELCGWQALTQRVGRVNRYGSTPGRVHVVTTLRPETIAVYGETATHTRELLDTVGEGTDLSPDSLDQIRQHHPDTVAAAVGQPAYSPVLHSKLLPTLTHTRPRPAADVHVQPFITGVTTDRVADVQLLWRNQPDTASLAAMPPTRLEQVTIPLSGLRALLHRAATGQLPREQAGIADAAGSEPATGTPEMTFPKPGQVPVWVPNSHGWTLAQGPRDITPGAIVVVPSSIGGHDHTGFNPAAADPVTDLSAIVAFDAGRWWLATADSLQVLHQHNRIPTTPAPDVWDALTTEERDPADVPDLVADLLPAPLDQCTVGTTTAHGVWLRAATADPDTGGGVVTLADHAAHVAATARHYSNTLALPPELRGALIWAGWHHDDGKADPAFQLALGARSTPLAKEHPAGRGLSTGVPTGWRHEALSAQQAHTAGHAELTVHLIATHHGWARPLLPPATGPGQQFPNHQRHETLTAEYGPWGLAWLETLVRLADHTASAAPEPHHASPTETAPTRDDADAAPAAQHDTVLHGITVESHLTWWAAAGALAAATTLDPQATLRFDGATPVVTSSLTTGEIATQVLELREHTRDLSNSLVNLNVASDRVDADEARATLATSPTTAAAALLCDTDPPDPKHRVDLRVPWHHNNSRLIATVWKTHHAPSDITQALLADEPDQHDGAGHYGMTTDQTNPVNVTGVRPSGRSALLPLVLAAAVSLPATGCARPAGTTRDRERRLPLPATATRWAELTTLLQTLPTWPEHEQHSIRYVETTTSNGKGKAWVATT